MTMVCEIQEIWSRSNDGLFEESLLGVILKDLSVGTNGPWLGGGALRRALSGKSLDSDFDFFFKDEDQLEQFSKVLVGLSFRKVKETEHHVQFRGYLTSADKEIDVQCIRFKYYENASQVIDSFDFTICQFAFDGNNLFYGKWSLWDLGRGKLVIHKITYPVSTMRRLLKYTKQGFTACGGCLSSVLTETANNPELLSKLDIQYVD